MRLIFFCFSFLPLSSSSRRGRVLGLVGLGVGAVVKDARALVVVHERHEETVSGEDGREGFPHHGDEDVDDRNDDEQEVQRVFLRGVACTDRCAEVTQASTQALALECIFM